ncbi:MAG: ankyrin repeat domain-containing protein [Bacteroidia bacterium]|nr:ankyrin repeat domain-containing protein [Bacteroidia bacterium]
MIINKIYLLEMPVFEAVLNHDLKFLRCYLETGGNPNLRNETGSTLLHEAVHEGDLNIVRHLLSFGASVENLDGYGNTPMHVACIFGHKKVAEELIRFGAEIDSTSEMRTWTPLMLAINESYTDMAEWLINQGANLNYVECNHGWTPLLVACEQGLKDMSIRLIKKGVKIDAKLTGGDVRGRSAIHLASYYGEVDIVKELLDQGQDINLTPEGGGLSALHWSVYNNHVRLLKFLLDNGANVNIRAGGIYQSRTPLHYAVSCDRLNMAKLLLDYEADPLMKDEEGQHPVDLALKRYRETGHLRHEKMLTLLETYI